MGTEALLARSRTDGLGSLVIRIAGAEKCRLRNRSIRSSPLIPGICWSTTRQPQGAGSPAPSSSAPRRVATNRETLDLKREFQGIANRKIIVQDDHHEPRGR